MVLLPWSAVYSVYMYTLCSLRQLYVISNIQKKKNFYLLPCSLGIDQPGTIAPMNQVLGELAEDLIY